MSSSPPFDKFNPHFNPEAYARGDPFPYDTAQTGLVDPDPDFTPLRFTPVPRKRVRRDGWTEETQRLFILSLSECGCVRQAAFSVGMSARSAYRLLDAEGADSFAEAWDEAISLGIERLRGEAMARAFEGAWVPVVRRGRLVRFEHRRNDRLAIGLLSGRSASVADNRERATSRRKHRAKMRARDALEAAEKKAAEAIAAAHQEVLDRIEAERLDPTLRKPRFAKRLPRIARL